MLFISEDEYPTMAGILQIGGRTVRNLSRMMNSTVTHDLGPISASALAFMAALQPDEQYDENEM